ncbi:Endonuclease/exonuclease/phosphatase [Absidia repens]|uniref:Endonuclease/exonuclease/phosphatase n=1 Tax=Absidia repens TaxID=90262 RepID=A0A1X2I1Z7_9FUNG|nr:Endonuclease/exonuclease/phosphatase [Absidia repens]
MDSTAAEKDKIRLEKKALRLEKKKLKQQLMQASGQQAPSAPSTAASGQTVSGQLPPPVPYQRKWQSTFRHRPITIMTYNVLAQTMCQRAIHPTAGDMLKWKTRRRMVMEEIGYYQPDLMCLQELDNYDEFYKDALAKLGYTTLFHRHETKRHGCVIAYRETMWKQIEYRTLDYDTDESCKPTQTTGNIGQLVALAYRQDNDDDHNLSGGGGVIISNTHLYWRPPSTYERCRQALIYRHHLFNFQKQLADKHPEQNWLPLMLGDFNTQPSDPFYAIATGRPLTEKHLQVLETSRRAFNDDDEDDGDDDDASENNNTTTTTATTTTTNDKNTCPTTAAEINNNDLMKIHDLLERIGPKPGDISMQSVYSHHKRLWDQQQSTVVQNDHDCYGVGEPDYTNRAHVFKGTLDYLFIPQQAVILDILMLPPKDVVQPALPNQHFGSDHVCLMAKILLP